MSAAGPPAISVVVMGYRNASTIVRAVSSVLEQRVTEAVQVIVVTSGGDDSATLVRHSFPTLPMLPTLPTLEVIERPQRLLPGAARNAGVAAARASLVAFLEGDCVAEPGWVAGRLALHRERRRAVASAMTSAGPWTPAGWAAHYLTFSARLPGRGPGAVAPPHPAVHGLSMPRDELLAIGGFREDLRVGEDTDAAHRLHERGLEIFFAPSVRTAHVGPRGTLGLLTDQFRRGARRARAEGLRLSSSRSLLTRAPRELHARLRWTTSQAWHHAPGERWRLVLLAPWLLAGAGANIAGWAREQGRLATGPGAPPRSPATPSPGALPCPAGAGPPVTPSPGTPVPVLSVVVVGYQNARTIVQAVGSVLAQRGAERVEVIVVTSGGDGSAERVRHRFPEIAVIDDPRRLLPGAARNAGLAATTGQVVAFLAGDCVAEPGWVAGRLALHREGRRAVASAITNAGPRTPAGWAAHYLTFSGRLPGRRASAVVPPDPAAHGLSVPRDDLLAIGGFPEHIRTGEDTDAARRLHERGLEILFAPSVQTGHLGPGGTVTMLADQFRRGARRSRDVGPAWPAVDPVRLVWRSALAGGRLFRQTWAQAWDGAVGDRRRLVLLVPWLAGGVAAYMAGWLREQRRASSPPAPQTVDSR